MQLLALVLVLIQVAAIGVPVTAIAAMNLDNPIEIVVPQEVEQFISEFIEPETSIELPQYIDSSYDLELRTVTATFSFKNPFNIDLKINILSADVMCASHNVLIGQAKLNEPVELPRGATSLFTVVYVWTQEAEDHFADLHADAESINIELVNIAVSISGISVDVPERYSFTVPLNQVSG